MDGARWLDDLSEPSHTMFRLLWFVYFGMNGWLNNPQLSLLLNSASG